MELSVYDNVINKHLRPILQKLLSQCTAKQQAFFKRMYPCGIEKMESKQVIRAIDQCEETIKKNLKTK